MAPDFKNVGKKQSRFTSLIINDNPFLEELNSYEIGKLKMSTAKYPYIPFLDSGDADLMLFKKLGEISNTQSSIINTICTYSFPEFIVAKNPVSGLRTINNTVSTSEETTMIDFIQSFTSFDELLFISNKIGKNILTYGNAVVELVLYDVNGVKSADIICHDAHKFRYMAVDTEVTFGMISDDFRPSYLKDNSPSIISMYPNFTDVSKGVSRTLIHIKNESIGRDYYGLPKSAGSLNYQILEYTMSKYLLDGYQNDFIGKVFIEFETASSEDQDNIKEFSNMMHNSFTNKGNDKKSIMISNRVQGMAKTDIHEFSNKTNEEYHKVIGEIAEKSIIVSHDWHPALNSKTPGSLGSSNEFISIYKQKHVTVIRPLQSKVSGLLSTCFGTISNHLGKDIGSLSLGYRDLSDEFTSSDNQVTQVITN